MLRAPLVDSRAHREAHLVGVRIGARVWARARVGVGVRVRDSVSVSVSVRVRVRAEAR